MKVELLHNTPLWVCAQAIRTCWDSHHLSDTCLHEEVEYFEDSLEGTCLTCGEKSTVKSPLPEAGEKDKELISRVGNKNKHKSVLEHLNYTFKVSGVSRALLQELARHRIASYSVKSTRYTLKELKDEDAFDPYIEGSRARAEKYLVFTKDDTVNSMSISALEGLRRVIAQGLANDITKYCLPEAYKVDLTMTINARSLQNLIELRTSPHALWEIRRFAYELFLSLPDEHKYLFDDYVHGDFIYEYNDKNRTNQDT